MKKLLIFSLLLLTATVNAQIIDNYGIRVGTGISNQNWQYKHWMFEKSSGTKQAKVGIAMFLNAEKKINDYLSFRPELGYIQKGFYEEIPFTQGDPIDIRKSKSQIPKKSTPEFNGIKGNVILHNIALNLDVKFSPLKTKMKPFLIVGLRGEYLLKNR